MIQNIKQSPLHLIVNPRSIAFFGASNRFSAMGTNQLSSLKSLGFEGNVYPIHPQEKRVLGFRAYRSVLELPEAPDLAVMVLPTGIVPQVLEECGRKGIQQAIVVSGGFSEVGGQGVELEQQLITIARRYGIRFLGPNCLGVANPHRKFNMTFLPFKGRPGFIGLASQSGSFITQMFGYLDRCGLGFSSGISVGNEANVDIVDGMQYLATCPHTKVIALYIESIRRGREFIAMAREIVPSKPIAAFYAGGSEAGQQAGLSHTGALAGPDALYDGIFRQCGIIRANSIPELFDFCLVLGSCRRPRNNRVIVQTHSGGPGAAAADACSRTGLKLPRLAPNTLEKLADLVPQTGSVSNPVDLTFSKNPMDYFEAIPNVLLADTAAGGLLIYYLTPTRLVRRSMENMGFDADQIPKLTEKLFDDQAGSLAALVKKHRKPIVGFTFQSHENLFIQKLVKHGLPVFPSPERAARAMFALVSYAQILDGR
ncbi:CoA-binding protein [Alkalispirochaeta odontotermitis]|nr:CoA-binding protein [Alkalispirochaeta odontotermitis]CAB1071219.1 Acetyl-CoA synthetase (ADP-forming) alpha chain (EC [Olavius algarvensis Delta 1 endosymbiont]